MKLETKVNWLIYSNTALEIIALAKLEVQRLLREIWYPQSQLFYYFRVSNIEYMKAKKGLDIK